MIDVSKALDYASNVFKTYSGLVNIAGSTDDIDEMLRQCFQRLVIGMRCYDESISTLLTEVVEES
jgi:hypothetical protein